MIPFVPQAFAISQLLHCPEYRLNVMKTEISLTLQSLIRNGIYQFWPSTIEFEDPLSYTNLPLIHIPIVQPALEPTKVNVVVGQGSSVIDFEIQTLDPDTDPKSL